MSTAVSATGDKKLEIWLQNEVVCSLQFLTFVGHARMLHLILWPIPRLYFPFSRENMSCFWAKHNSLSMANMCQTFATKFVNCQNLECLQKDVCVCVCMCLYFSRKGKSGECHKFYRENLRACACVCVPNRCWHAFNFSTVNCLCA